MVNACGIRTHSYIHLYILNLLHVVFCSFFLSKCEASAPLMCSVFQPLPSGVSTCQIHFFPHPHFHQHFRSRALHYLCQVQATFLFGLCLFSRLTSSHLLQQRRLLLCNCRKVSWSVAPSLKLGWVLCSARFRTYSVSSFTVAWFQKPSVITKWEGRTLIYRSMTSCPASSETPCSRNTNTCGSLQFPFVSEFEILSKSKLHPGLVSTQR